MSVLSVWRPPFALRPEVAWLPDGLSLAEMAGRMPGLPADFDRRGVICVNGRPVPPASWRLVRPRPRAGGVPVEVTFHAPPMGGGDGDGGKQVLALVASIALTAAVGAIVAGKLATAGGLFQAGSLSATFLAAGVSLAGSLLIGALTAPPAAQAQPRQRPAEGPASAQGNMLEPNGPVPRVIGERRVYPPLACETLIAFDGQDEVVEAVYMLSGPHRLSDIRIGAAPVADIAGLEIETREGWPGEPALDLVRRYGRTEALQAELVGHSVDDSDGARLDHFVDQALALPQSQVVATRAAPDEHWLHLVLPQGLHYRGEAATRMRLPLRLRMRPRGSGGAWRNLPELHIAAANLRQMRLAIRLIWTGRPASPTAAAVEGWVEARRACPDQSAAPAGGGWTADPAFGTSGDAWMAASNLGSSGVQGVEMDRSEVRILLDPADWPPGRWEIEIIRGAAFAAADYSSSAYTVGGSVWALFGWREPSAPRIVRSRDGVADSLYLLRSTSVRHAPPVAAGDVALVAIRARNRQLERLSVLAGGWVRDWDGGGWADWQVTSNPAPHLRDIYAGRLNARPVPAEIIDDADLVAWRGDCTAQGWTCNHLSEDESVAEAAQVVAACGYARPRWSDLTGVVRERDRSADLPVQIFTPRNSTGFRWTKALPDLPDGFRATFADAADDWQPRQIDVVRRGVVAPMRVPEQIVLQGIDTEAGARARLGFDLAQAEARGTYYLLDAPAEAIVCRRGDLVGVAHDEIDRWMGAGRIVERDYDGDGLVTAVGLDTEVDMVEEPDVWETDDFWAVPDVWLLGARMAVAVRGPAGPGPALALSVQTGRSTWLGFAVPQPAADLPDGALAVVHRARRGMLRAIVADIQPRRDLTATLTLVDEAPELHA